MRIINKSSMEKNFKVEGKWFHFEKGEAKEGFPEGFLEENGLTEDFEMIEEGEPLIEEYGIKEVKKCRKQK